MKLLGKKSKKHQCDIKPVFWRCADCGFQIGSSEIMNALMAIKEFGRNDAMLLIGVLDAEFGKERASGFVEKLKRFVEALKK